MANPEHLAILKKGVDAWNRWREENPGIQPDLSQIALCCLPLRGVNFSGVNLNHAHFTKQVLNETDLTGANLSGGDLIEAVLLRARLSRANLCGADCSRAMFIGADLSGADLCSGQFFSANLSHTILRAARLEGADMRQSILAGADLTQAKLTGAKLYATSRDDWVIDGVECRYVFWDAEGEIRSPKDRNLAPGEFERLYQTLPSIEYIFRNGMTPMDPLIMDRVVQAIRGHTPEFDLQIDSISARGLAPSIKFTVQQEQHKEPALQMIVAGYESRVQRLEAEKDRLYDLLALAIDKPGTRLLVAGHDIITADGNATINIDQHVEYITNLRDTIAAQPEDSPTFAKVAKKTALDLIGSALKDVAKGQVKKAAEQIIELGKGLGPVILNTAAYAFFKNMMDGG